MATTLASKAWCALEDYVTAKKYGIDRFTLMVERKEVLGQEQWHVGFEYGSKNINQLTWVTKRSRCVICIIFLAMMSAIII